jgi:WD40 repeat protein/predicted Ser/Thr protein kinase
MADKRLCGKCGAELTDVGAERLCPACLLEGGLDAGSAATGKPTLPASSVSDSAPTTAPASFGDYELLEEIGRGGMGIVYKARQASLDRTVAVKVLLSGRLAGPEFVQRFRTEAAAAASLQHPNIVAIHEVGFRAGQHFFAMDYVAGRSLAQITRDGPLPARRAAGYVKTIAEAIQYAHERGVLHRDLTPANVLIDENDQPKVTDFGLAKRLEKETELTLSGQVLGSPNYMPPEQAAARRGLVGVRSDVYSLGAILYHLLTARAPFLGDTIAKTLHQVQNDEPVSPRLLNGAVPQDLATICVKCLEKEPDKRYATAEALADDLGRFLDRKPILARPISRLEKLGRWCRRNPVIATLAAAAVFIFLLGFAGVTWEGQRAREAAADARRQGNIAQGRLYAAQMRLAFTAYKEGRIGAGLALIRAQQPAPGEPDFRGFDWGYLYRLCLQSQGKVIANNASGFHAVDFSPDGRTAALGTGDGMVEIFDLNSRQRVDRWQAHSGVLAGLVFCPGNANWLATVSGDDGLLKLWDLAGKRVVFTTETLTGMHTFVRVAFSPRGRFLAATAPDGQSLNLWEVRSSPPGGVPTVGLKANLPFVGPAAFSPDERTMAVCNGSSPFFQFNVALYDLSDGTLVDLGPAHSDGITSVAFSRDGSKLATGSSDERVVLWDIKSRATDRMCQANFIVVSSVAFAPDGQTLFVSSWDGRIYSWDLKEPAQPNILAGHNAAVNGLAISPDGRSLASAGQDGTARLWDTRSDGTASLAQPYPEFTTLLRPEDTISPATGQRGIWGVAVSPDQLRLAAATLDKLILWDLQTGAVVTEVAAIDLFRVETAKFRSITFSPDGTRLAAGGDNGAVALLDGVTLQPLQGPIQLHGSQITDIAYGLNGTVLATGGGFGTGIKLTDATTGQRIADFNGVEGFYPMQPLAVSPDGTRLALGSPDQSIRLWDIASRRLLATCPKKVRFPFCMRFAPDGRLLAFSDTFGFLYLWDLSGQRPMRKLAGHNGAVTALAFAPDGTLASGGMDHTIRLWHPDIDQEVAILEGHRGWVLWVAFAEHGKTLISGSTDGTLNLWHALSFEETEAGEKVSQAKP